jgi:hypothetical protein
VPIESDEDVVIKTTNYVNGQIDKTINIIHLGQIDTTIKLNPFRTNRHNHKSKSI